MASLGDISASVIGKGIVILPLSEYQELLNQLEYYVRRLAKSENLKRAESEQQGGSTIG